MSCHNIGSGINEITKEMMALYDQGELSLKTAKRLMFVARRATAVCDGIESEAVASISKGGEDAHCGMCLRKAELRSLLEVCNHLEKKIYEYLNKEEDPLIHDGLCTECWKRLLEEK